MQGLVQPCWRLGAGSSQCQFTLQVVQLSELATSDGGFACAYFRPILFAEWLGGFVHQKLQEPVCCGEFLVGKQINQMVKCFFGAHCLILHSLRYGTVF